MPSYLPQLLPLTLVNQCDEKRPYCFNCVRHSVVCSLSNDAADTECSRGVISPAARLRSSQPLPPLEEIWGRGLELMHHYTVSTAQTLAHRPDMKYTWRVTIPEMAIGCPYTMHGLLAIASLHKAHLLPAQRDTYLDTAAWHQNSGLVGFRKALDTLGEHNFKDILVFASTITLSVCMHPVRTQPEEAHSLQSALELFVFIRGMRNILHPYQERLAGTNLGSLVTGVWIITPSDPCWDRPVMELTPLPGDIFEALKKLRHFYSVNLSGDIQSDYIQGVRQLEDASKLVSHAGSRPEIGMFLLVAYTIPETIMRDMESLTPYGLVFLSYLTVMSRVLEGFFWFMAGWSRRLFAIIDAHMPEHLPLLEIISWPRQQVFRV